MKERLQAVFNVMQRIETHGESTVMMADCLREIAAVIDGLGRESKEEDQCQQ